METLGSEGDTADPAVFPASLSAFPKDSIVAGKVGLVLEHSAVSDEQGMRIAKLAVADFRSQRVKRLDVGFDSSCRLNCRASGLCRRETIAGCAGTAVRTQKSNGHSSAKCVHLFDP